MTATSEQNSNTEIIHPKALARLFIEYGDQLTAFQICEFWRRREPTNPAIDEIEAEAASSTRSQTVPPPLDEELAERYLAQGYLEEALLIYQRLAFDPHFETEIQDRLELVGDFLSFELPPDAHPLQVKAEKHIRDRSLALALILYHELCDLHPEFVYAQHRLNQLRTILGELPESHRFSHDEEKDQLSDVVALETKFSQEIPTGVMKHRSENRQRLAVHTKKDISLPDFFEPDSAADEGDDIDPLAITEQINVAPHVGIPNQQFGDAPTQLVDLPVDTEDCRTIVELPTDITTIPQCASDRPSVASAAKLAEPLGVLIRPIVIIP